MNVENIKDFLNKKDYDIRKSKNGRWIDQKCTPDVLTIIADCILNFIGEDNNKTFKSKEIQLSDYSDKTIRLYFGKPGTKKKCVENEYDKFFSQPLKLLAYADILSEKKEGNSNIYSINNHDLLEYISLSDKNSFNFIFEYIQKVLSDSDILSNFNDFFNDQNSENFQKLKDNYINFTINNTKINGKTECSRIFTKVINPLAFRYKKFGTSKGRFSKKYFSFTDLLYNKENFRDIYSKKT